MRSSPRIIYTLLFLSEVTSVGEPPGAVRNNRLDGAL
jgi:hypothetical protein